MYHDVDILTFLRSSQWAATVNTTTWPCLGAVQIPWTCLVPLLSFKTFYWRVGRKLGFGGKKTEILEGAVFYQINL